MPQLTQPVTIDQLPPAGQEKILQRTDGVLLYGQCKYTAQDASDRVWWLSLPDADTTIAEEDIAMWIEPV